MEPLKGNLVRLRAIEPGDEDLLYKWENDQKIWQVSNTLTPFSRQVLHQYLEQAHLDIFQARQLRMVIEVIESEKPVGLIDLFDFDAFHQRAGLGILIGETADRGKGFAKDAIKTTLVYAFTVLLLNQVYSSIDESNPVSLNLFKATGFRVTGNKEKWNRSSSGWTDEWFLQITSDEWLVRDLKEGISSKNE
ncbi:MAG: GNAT family protein [Bacteroidales bacterium]|nr:GNAT family protein [Bacteroidales bacterium]